MTSQTMLLTDMVTPVEAQALPISVMARLKAMTPASEPPYCSFTLMAMSPNSPSFRRFFRKVSRSPCWSSLAATGSSSDLAKLRAVSCIIFWVSVSSRFINASSPLQDLSWTVLAGARAVFFCPR